MTTQMHVDDSAQGFQRAQSPLLLGLNFTPEDVLFAQHWRASVLFVSTWLKVPLRVLQGSTRPASFTVEWRSAAMNT
jgi:hypothetical protein